MHGNKKPILIGSKFGRLTVTADLDTDYKYKRWCTASCECGIIKNYLYQQLKSGNTKSCGCYASEHPSRYIHGDSKTLLYKVYYGMLERCNLPKNTAYYKYGGRGIKVCPEWEKSYINFKKWAENNGYGPSLSLDRINTNGHYEPKNCRFTTATIQALNTGRNNKNTSGIKNVYFHKNQKKWHARITVDGKRIHIGVYVTKEEAHIALFEYFTKHNLIEHIRGHSYG